MIDRKTEKDTLVQRCKIVFNEIFQAGPKRNFFFLEKGANASLHLSVVFPSLYSIRAHPHVRLSVHPYVLPSVRLAVHISQNIDVLSFFRS